MDLQRTQEILAARATGCTLRELGLRYGITRERVRQIELRADPNSAAKALAAQRKTSAAKAAKKRADWLAAATHTVTCRTCGLQFVATRKNAVYCSKECSYLGGIQLSSKYNWRQVSEGNPRYIAIARRANAKHRLKKSLLQCARRVLAAQDTGVCDGDELTRLSEAIRRFTEFTWSPQE